MKAKVLFVVSSLFSMTLVMCTPKADNRTIEERLKAESRITITSTSGSKYFPQVFSLTFKQYIDHSNPSLGTFEQRLELGFKSFEKPMVFVTEGYYDVGGHYNYAGDENEIAYLLGCNYITMEHRYFGESLPNTISYDDAESWQYLTTEQAAGDAHEVVTTLKKIFKKKWLSTGGSKSGMTTEAFCYYHPGDVDLYVPYVAPYCNSRYDTRMAKFVYEEAGNLQYGETRAEEIRNEVLQFQVKMLKYRDVLAPRYYQEGVSASVTYSNYTTADILYDCAIFDFGVGFWQYYQNYTKLESCLNKPETTESEISSKRSACYSFFKSICAPDDFGLNTDYTPYYIQAWQELGNYCFDFSYIREVLPESVNLVITPAEESTAAFKLALSESQLAFEQKDLMYTKINNMLSTTNENFIIIYGSSDPWYAVRPDDVTGRNNINIYVNDNYPHTANIANFDADVKAEIMDKLNTYMN